MSNIRAGQLAVSGEWAKHLRRWGKKIFWRRHRRLEKRVIRRETKEQIDA